MKLIILSIALFVSTIALCQDRINISVAPTYSYWTYFDRTDEVKKIASLWNDIEKPLLTVGGSMGYEKSLNDKTSIQLDGEIITLGDRVPKKSIFFSGQEPQVYPQSKVNAKHTYILLGVSINRRLLKTSNYNLSLGLGLSPTYLATATINMTWFEDAQTKTKSTTSIFETETVSKFNLQSRLCLKNEISVNDKLSVLFQPTVRFMVKSDVKDVVLKRVYYGLSLNTGIILSI